MEKEILMQLGFVLTAPSAYRFLQRYRMLSRVYQDKEVFYYGQYILEVSLLDASLLQFKPSELAAAAASMAVASSNPAWISSTEVKRTWPFFGSMSVNPYLCRLSMLSYT